MRRILFSSIVLIYALLIAGCGGGALLQEADPAISPASATVSTGQTFQFQLTSNGAAVTDVGGLGLIWTVNGIAGGNSTVGTISDTGLFTAPDTVPDPATETINAGSNFVQASITINGNSGTGGGGGGGSTPSATITVSPSSIAPGQNATLSWSSANVDNCTINNDTSVNGDPVGLSGSVQVSPTATTTYDLSCTGSNGPATNSATLTVQVTNSGIGVTLMPSTATIASGQSMQLTATISNDTGGQGVAWSSTPIANLIAPSFANPLIATFTAPIVTSNTVITVTVASVADPTASATATITVTPQQTNGGSCTGNGAGSPFISISPDSPSLQFGGSQLLIATIMANGLTDDGVTWVLAPGLGVSASDEGTLTPQGPTTALYQATATVFSTATVTATSVQCPGVIGKATIQIGAQ